MTDARCEPRDVAARFWSKVDKTGGADACWPWLGGTDGRDGYGTFHLNGKTQKATRVAWMLTHAEPVPQGKHVCHSCDNPPCVNPAHIWIGTPSDNHKDSFIKGRCAILRIGEKTQDKRRAWTHCSAGHEFTAANTFVTKLGRRQCRTCLRKWKATFDAKRRSAIRSRGEPR